jgi:superfamily II DNA or RNA helicase
MQCGRIRYTADATAQISNQSFERILVPRFTIYRNVNPNDKETFIQTIQKLAEDDARNSLIVDDVKKVLQEMRTPIILTSLTSHVRKLVQMLEPITDNVIALIGADSSKEKKLAMAHLSSISPSESMVVVATGKYIGEGFDYPRLDTLFLALPISWKGNIQQYAGRLHREYKGKTEVRIYDYVDIHVPVCDSMYRKRLRGYKSVGYGNPSSILTETKSSQDVIYMMDRHTKRYSRMIYSQQSIVLLFLV